MKITVCYYFAICMIPIHGFSEPDCTEPQLLVKETYCGYNNVTALTMYTFKEEFRVNLTEFDLSDGCAIDFDEPFPLNNTYYIECDTEKVDCLNEDDDKVTKESYYLECEELDKVSDKLVKAKGIVENNPIVSGNSGKIATILGSSVAALSGVVLFAYGAHKLKSLLQSGTYLFPDTPSAPGFMELA